MLLVVLGYNGATLGCVGEGVAFLILSMLNDNYALTKRDVEPHTNYDFETHSQWKASGNCTTTHCMLADGVPLHTWTSVGNGSYNGAPYELHFMNTGKNHGYSATRGLPSNRTMVADIERRARRGNLQVTLYSPQTHPWVFGDITEKEYYQSLIDVTTYAAMDSANKGYTIPVTPGKIIVLLSSTVVIVYMRVCWIFPILLWVLLSGCHLPMLTTTYQVAPLKKTNHTLLLFTHTMAIR
jgi:hypothetical protein